MLFEATTRIPVATSARRCMIKSFCVANSADCSVKLQSNGQLGKIDEDPSCRIRAECLL
jgi:hypothetical protein